MRALVNWLIRLGDAFSQLLNVLVFGGHPNHSVSGDAWRFKREPLRRVIDFVFRPFEKNHCYNAHLSDVRHASRLLQEWNDAHKIQ
jgi:hypothetical protein